MTTIECTRLVIDVILVLLIAGMLYALYKIVEKSQKTHEKLNCLLKRAKSCNNKDELSTLYEELVHIHKHECWHRSFGQKVTEIKTVIETKYEML
jgi:hypothetical protein